MKLISKKSSDTPFKVIFNFMFYWLNELVFLPSGVTSWNSDRSQWLSPSGGWRGPAARGLGHRLLHGSRPESFAVQRPAGGLTREAAVLWAPRKLHEDMVTTVFHEQWGKFSTKISALEKILFFSNSGKLCGN